MTKGKLWSHRFCNFIDFPESWQNCAGFSASWRANGSSQKSADRRFSCCNPRQRDVGHGEGASDVARRRPAIRAIWRGLPQMRQRATRRRTCARKRLASPPLGSSIRATSAKAWFSVRAQTTGRRRQAPARREDRPRGRLYRESNAPLFRTPVQNPIRPAARKAPAPLDRPREARPGRQTKPAAHRRAPPLRCRRRRDSREDRENLP